MALPGVENDIDVGMALEVPANSGAASVERMSGNDDDVVKGVARIGGAA